MKGEGGNGILEMTYEEFLEEYVIHPEYWMCFSFYFKNMIYQFDFDEPLTHGFKDPKVCPYQLLVYKPGRKDTYGYPKWHFISESKWYSSFYEAITNEKIDGLTFEEVYNSPDSELIDLN